MPKGKPYNTKTVRMGGSETPMSVMGNQGKPVRVQPMHSMSRPTKSIPFPDGVKPRRK